MGAIASRFAEVYRDYESDGLPASGPHEPVKSEIRDLGPKIESAIATMGLGSLLSVAKATRALLDADLAHAADTVAIVYDDATEANNDLYVKTGASGAGAWTRTDALHQVIAGVDAPYRDEMLAALAEFNATLAGVGLSNSAIAGFFFAIVSSLGQMALAVDSTTGDVVIGRLRDNDGNDVFEQLQATRAALAEAQVTLDLLAPSLSYARAKASAYHAIGRQVAAVDPLTLLSFTNDLGATHTLPDVVDRDHPFIRRLHGNPEYAAGYPAGLFVTLTSIHYDGSTPSAGYLGASEIVYGGRYLEVLMKTSVFGALMAYVDGILTSAAGYAGFNTNDGTFGYAKFDLGSAAVRRIRFEASNQLGGFRLEAGYPLLDPTPRVRCNMLVLGDSITEPTGASHPVTGYPMLLADLLGVDNVIPSGVGGTGYVAPGPGGRVNLRDRIDAELENFPDDDPVIDVILFTMGVNDLSTGVSGGHSFTDNVAYCLKHARARWPDALIMASGPLHGYDIGVDQAAKAAIIEAACADVTRCYFIDCSTWITVADTAAYFPGGYGDPHPNDAGHAHYASKFNTAIRSIISEKL